MGAIEQYIPTLMFLLLLIITIKRQWRSLLHPSVTVVALYFFCFLFGVALVDTDNLHFFRMSHSAGALWGLCAILFLAMTPAYFIKKANAAEMCSHPSVKAMIYFLAPFAWFGFAYMLPFAFSSMNLGADVVRPTLATEAPVPVGRLTTLAVGVSAFYPVYSLLLFIATIRQYPFILRASMFIGLSTSILHAMVYTARDIFVWLPLTFVFCFWMLSGQMSILNKRAILRVTYLVVLICAGVITLFTMQRFHGRTKISTSQSMLMYYGAQSYVFAERVAEQNDFYEGNLRFPVFRKIFGLESTEIVRTKNNEWMFGTFAADFYSIRGWAFAIGFTAMFSIALILLFLFTRTRSPVSYMLLCTMYYQFMTTGVFYFRLGGNAGNYYYLIMAAVVMILIYIDALRGVTGTLRKQLPTGTHT